MEWNGVVDKNIYIGLDHKRWVKIVIYRPNIR